ncbi:hypothetical protein AVEN_138789-1 [Araneus ventricosus]|uniref:Uncharacterized protein n=1 Tax=Araneus ventricosus TaxID=182803 RepID=A0A4Y2M310_ARAVE|nr:hypothetical protein AVEN_138789-1 [Araneus ventricosus]
MRAILNRAHMTMATPGPASPSPNFRATPAGGHMSPTDLTRPAYTVVFRWNRVLSLEFQSQTSGCFHQASAAPIIYLKKCNLSINVLDIAPNRRLELRRRFKK